MRSPSEIETYELATGDALALIRELPDNCVQHVTTSPPYYLLRAYATDPQIWGGQDDCEHVWGEEVPGSSRGGSGPGSKSVRAGEESSAYGRAATRGKFCQVCGAWCGELGLEPTPDLFVEHLVLVFRELRRVLRKDGTVFLNIGDSYNSSAPGNKKPMSKSTLKGAQTSESYRKRLESTEQEQQAGRRLLAGSYKPKDLLGIPWQLALALREDGWWLRQDVIWSKAGGNCPRCYYRIEKGSTKPESVKDRFVKAHEYVFLLTKSKSYYFDHEAAKEANSSANRRDVLHISSQSFRGAHYATMPEALAEIGVLAGTSEHGACASCGAPYKRVVKKGEPDRKWQKVSGGNEAGEYHGENTKDYEEHKAEKASDLKRRILAGMRKSETVGWKQTCKCKNPGDPVPCLVFDPFSGAATTGAVALRLGRRYLGLELLESNNTEIATPRLEAALLEKQDPEQISFLTLDSGVYHGKAEILLQRVPPASVRLILTDPPYNTSRVNNFHTMNRTGMNFDWDGGFDQEAWIRLADRSLMPGGSIVVWNDWKIIGLIAHLLIDMGYKVKRNLTWIKSNPAPFNRNRLPAQRVEVGLWAVKPGAKWVFHRRLDRGYEDFVFEYSIPGSKKGRPRHEAKKPDGLFAEIIEILTDEDDLVLDPFAGGGTTAYAAELTGRRHISFEESAQWYAEAVLHWEEGAIDAGDYEPPDVVLADEAPKEEPEESVELEQVTKLVPPTTAKPSAPLKKIRLKKKQ